MAYKIGQVTYKANKTYMSPISATLSTIRTSSNLSDRVFDDLALSGSFTPENVYYLRCKVKRDLEKDLTIVVNLYKDEDTSLSENQNLDTIEVGHYMPGVTEEYAIVEIMFNPLDTYSYLGFVISRQATDFQGNVTTIQEILWTGEDGIFATVNNILDKSQVSKIGFQSRPGTLITVNKETIRLGKSGIYEINNGTDIYSVGVAGFGGKVEPFILDYAYES